MLSFKEGGYNERILLFVTVSGFLLRWLLSDLTFQPDIHAFRSWMESSVQLGVVASYGRQVSTPWTPIYPPVAIYLLYASGKLYQWLVSPGFQIIDPAFMQFVKLPSMIADVLTAAGIGDVVRRVRSRGMGLIAAAIYLAHPGVLYDSTFWGQFDAPYAFFLFFALLAVAYDRPVSGTVLFTLACLTKQQAAVFAPVFLWIILCLRPQRIGRCIAAGIATLVVCLLPFILAGATDRIVGLFRIGEILGESRLSWRAYNLWWLLFGQAAWDMSARQPVLGPITIGQIGITLFLAFYAAVLFALRRRLRAARGLGDRCQTILLASAAVALGMFMLAPEMHDRYVFPFFAIALPLVFVRPLDAIAYLLASVAFFLNLLAVFPYDPFSRFLQPLADQSRLIALAYLATFLWFCWRLFAPRQRRTIGHADAHDG